MGMEWDSFKRHIGYIILFSAIVYAVFITVLLVFFGKCLDDKQIYWGFFTNITSTVLGWLLGKASTVIDYQYGSSAPVPKHKEEEKPVEEAK